jgi:hypothetical protein
MGRIMSPPWLGRPESDVKMTHFYFKRRTYETEEEEVPQETTP